MTLQERRTLRPLVREAPVALVANGSTLAVMMATPDDLEDFALGFALTEGIADTAEELKDLEIIEHAEGYEARFWLRGPAARRLSHRQRAMIGPVGCGLCGIDSLAGVDRDLPPVPGTRPTLDLAEISAAPDLLRAHQPEHDRTGASHAAGFLLPGGGIALAREDVGRHNALDKLAGALSRTGHDPAAGAVVLTSRVSTEMVQKTVAMGVPVLIAVSAATDYAARLAARAGLALITQVRGGGYRVQGEPFAGAGRDAGAMAAAAQSCPARSRETMRDFGR